MLVFGIEEKNGRSLTVRYGSGKTDAQIVITQGQKKMTMKLNELELKGFGDFLKTIAGYIHEEEFDRSLRDDDEQEEDLLSS